MKKQATKLLSVTATLMLGIGLLSFNTLKNKEMKEKKVKTIEYKLDGDIINVSADSLWTIVGDGYANAGVWATNVDHSVGKGTPEFQGATCDERSCDINATGFSAITEKLVQYDTSLRELTFSVTEGLPGFVTLAQNHWTVESLSDSTSRLKMHVTMEMKPFMGTLMAGMMRKNLKTLLPTISNDLKIYAETGKVSASKEARMASLK